MRALVAAVFILLGGCAIVPGQAAENQPPRQTPVADDPRWSTPAPPYPKAARAAHMQGRGIVRISTDASGRVVSATVRQSMGNDALDDDTTKFALAHWHGPPNTSRDVPITYRLVAPASPSQTPGKDWYTPKPPYPYQAIKAHGQGTGSVRVTMPP